MKHVFWGFLIAAVLAFLNDRFVFESVGIPSSSMRPNLLPGERAFLQRLGYGDIRRWDMVVTRDPRTGIRIVKRVVGLPGDCLRLEDSWRVVVENAFIEYRKDPSDYGAYNEAEHHVILTRADPKWSFPTVFGKERLCLQSDEFYILGDNRLASEDGRVFGPVKRATIDGVMRRIWFSFDRTTGQMRWSRIAK